MRQEEFAGEHCFLDALKKYCAQFSVEEVRRLAEENGRNDIELMKAEVGEINIADATELK